MTESNIVNLRVIMVDDNPKLRRTISDHCDTIQNEINEEFAGKGVQLKIHKKEFDTIESFLKYLEKNIIHVLVIDLKFGQQDRDRRGWHGVDAVLPLEIIPVVVYSAYVEEDVSDKYKHIFIAKSSKGDANIGLILKKMILIKMRLMLEQDRILHEFHNLTLETICGLFDPDALDKTSEKVLSEIAVNRLKTVLLNNPLMGEKEFSQESIFLFPPLMQMDLPNSLMLGDIIKCRDKFYIVLSPSCDLVISEGRSNKIQNVLLIPCYLNSEDVPSLRGLENNKKDEKISQFIRSGSVKVQKCPSKLFSVDYLLFSFKDYVTYSYLKLIKNITSGEIQKVCTISTPYAESLQNLFIRDFSRIGTPDTLDINKEKEDGRKFVRQSQQ